MNAPLVETRPLYGIGTVARLVGIKPDTLRIWERRYGLGASQKSGSGRRLYTQTDLEHLQLVSSLVAGGMRIGEIAALEGKTLQALAEQHGIRPVDSAVERRPRVLFSGENLCHWLDQHPGCLSRMESMLLRLPLAQVAAGEHLAGASVDMLVVECAALGKEQVAQIIELKQRLDAGAGAVFYQFSNQACLSALLEHGIGANKLPLDNDVFAATMNRLRRSLEVVRGNADAGELATTQRRLFTDVELTDIGLQSDALECACNQHLADLIQSLATFEQYSSQCRADSWRDAATHACIYAYTNQARWLMEKALRAALENEAQHPPGTQ